MTNDELIKKAMANPKLGILGEVFVMQALEHYCDLVIDEKDALIKNYEQEIKDGKFPFVNMYSWITCAEEIKAMFDSRDRFKEKKQPK